MWAVVQRVTRASVTVENNVVGQIGPGLLVLLGVETDDTDTDADYIAGKVADVRLFAPLADDLPERSLAETGQAALVVSQFTLLGGLPQRAASVVVPRRPPR